MTQIARLHSRALISVTGEDWASFLQGLITQDVETLKDGQLRFGALLTPQGRLLYDMFILGEAQGCRLDVAAEHRAAIMQRLMIYRLRAKVVIEADETPVFAVWPASADPGGRTDPRLPELGVRIYESEPTPNTDEAAYEVHRLACGVPGPADWGSDRTYPIEANFDLLNGIDFKKGCFVGQETTSRMKRRGQIKSRMAPVTLSASTAETEILNGTLRAGEVRSVIGDRGMALVRLDRISGDLTLGGAGLQLDMPEWLKPSAEIGPQTQG
ncbi:MAG: glycine cleavage system protein T [Alphaproteobacteria bacterium PA2]|nr:MAG: glycine cleavage system protein T [Alphaproteobacteria bacterium PA2]